MDFELTDEQQLIRDAVREFAEAEVAPIAAELDRDHRFPYELLPRLSYTWNEIIALHAGYRLLSMDFESSDLEYDVREAGWLFGVGFHF